MAKICIYDNDTSGMRVGRLRGWCNTNVERMLTWECFLFSSFEKANIWDLFEKMRFISERSEEMGRTKQEAIDNIQKRQDERRMLISYEEASKRYSLGVTSLRKRAKECRALYKIGKSALINVRIMDEYMETFRV